MSESFKIIGQIGMLVTVFAGVTAWAVGVLFAFKMLAHARPGVRVWSSQTRWNPMNLLVMPSLLTDEGRRCRRNAFRATIIFFGCVGLGFVFGLVAHWL